MPVSRKANLREPRRLGAVPGGVCPLGCSARGGRGDERGGTARVAMLSAQEQLQARFLYARWWLGSEAYCAAVEAVRPGERG